MADNNQSSQATTDSQAPTSDDFGVHSDEIVPKQIANHDKTLLTSVMADGQWININDTLQLNNRQKDLHRVHNEVVEAQKGIVDAKAAADDATRKADSAVQTAQVTSDTVANMSGAISDATSGAAAAVSQAKEALSNADATKTELQASINSNSKAIELKADKTTVDAVSGTVKENSASIDVLNGQIKQAVTSSTIDGLLDKKGYATQTYTQDLVKQTSDTWGVNLSKLEGKVDDNHQLDVKQMTDLQTSIDGIQGTVADNEKKTESRFTQLADGFQSKVFDAINNSTTKGAAFNGKYTTLTGVVDLNTITTTGNYYIDGQLVNSPYADDGNTGHTASGHFIFMAFYEGDASAFGKDKGKYYPHEQIYREGDSGLYNRYTDSWDWPDDSSTLKVDTWKDWHQDAQSSITQLKDDINWKVSNGDLISQINMEAGRTLIQSDKLYLDAKSVVFGKDTKAFIPSAAITDISADKIVSGTLDADKIRVINLTADNIHGGTLDVGDMNIKNLTADDITSGMLSSVIVRSGDNNSYFETIGNAILWNKDVKNNSMADGTIIDSLIGTVFFLNQAKDGKSLLNIVDNRAVQIIGEASLGYLDKNQKFVNDAGALGCPRIVVGQNIFDRDKGFSEVTDYDSAVLQYVNDKEFTHLQYGQGFLVHLDDSQAKSIFSVQKDNHAGLYVGAGSKGNQIQMSANNGLHLKDGTIINDENNINGTHILTNLICHNLHVTNWFGADKTKQRVVETSQGHLGINAYETAEPYFGDIGENKTDDTKQVVIGIDRIFGETINTDVAYQVFLQSYSSARVWVAKRYPNRFVVESDQPNAPFGWELKARQKGYEHTRLQNMDNMPNA